MKSVNVPPASMPMRIRRAYSVSNASNTCSA